MNKIRYILISIHTTNIHARHDWWWKKIMQQHIVYWTDTEKGMVIASAVLDPQGGYG